MAEQGFEYAPFVPDGAVPMVPALDPDNREWVEQWGYGIAISPHSPSVAPTATVVADPNESYVAGLSGPQHEAYVTALYGPISTQDEFDDPNFEWVQDWTTSGCDGAARYHASPAAQIRSVDEFASLIDEIDAFLLDRHLDPRFADLDAEWVACMAGRGQSGFVRQHEAAQSVWSRFSALTFQDEIAPEELAALAADERSLAGDDLECREQTDYSQRQREILDGMEREFIEQHRAELEAMRNAYEQASGGE